LREELDRGLSFPAARQAALESMDLDASLLATPNNILAVEYCKAILSQNASMQPFPIHREGGYHDTVPDPENPSATALRQCFPNGNWSDYVPAAAADCFQNATAHTLAAGERAILYKLRSMTDAEFDFDDGGFRGWGSVFEIPCGTRKRLLWVTFDRTRGSNYNWSYGNVYVYESETFK
jgi:predicted nucleotidyltransferase